MKKISFVLLAILFTFYSCKNKPGYVIDANIDGSNSMIFNLYVIEGNNLQVIDSATSKNDAFTMKGSIDYPRPVVLEARGLGFAKTFFLENSKISITGSVDKFGELAVSGSTIQDESVELENMLQSFADKLGDIEGQYQEAVIANDEKLMQQYESEYENVYSQILDVQKSFIKSNPSSYLVPDVLSSMIYELDANELNDMLSGLSPEIAALPSVVSMSETAKKMMTVAIGQKAPDFTLNDVSGTPVSLYSKLGPKLLLLDFWAAWCNPCRQENPNVVKVYKEFNKKGFDVFGVSLDRTKEDWEKAIKDDKLTWTHVSDLNYWDNAAAKLYSVTAIPCNFLLDENGVIVARNLRGDALYNFVSERLK